MANNENNKTTMTKADLEAKNAELEARLAQLEALLAAKAEQTETVAPVVKEQPTVAPAAVSSDVTLVYCSDSLGYAKISNMELHFNRFGEEFVMSRSQFDELVGKYRAWFDKGILAVSYRNVDVAAAKGIRTDKEYGLSFDTLKKLGTMTTAQIEKLWNDTEIFSHRQSIVSYFKRNFIEDTPGFRDRAKIDLLNRLTDGGFSREQDELGGKIKYPPLNF